MTAAKAKTKLLGRLGAATIGGWLFVFGLMSLTVVTATVARALSFEDAQALSILVAFPIFVSAFCWAFVARSGLRAWVVLAGGGAFMTLASWLLARGAG